MRIVIELKGRAGRAPKVFAWLVRRALEGMVIYNRALIKAGNLKPIYSSGVRFRNEPPGTETFKDASIVQRLGHGDCAHLCAWRVAELQEKGEPASIRIKWAPSRRLKGTRLYHVQVRRGDGRVEDPSRLLGMGEG